MRSAPGETRSDVGHPSRFPATYRHPDAKAYRKPGGAWDAPTLDRLLTHADESAVAVVDGSRRISHAEVASSARRLASYLVAQGVRRRSAVAWQLPNSYEALLLYRATWQLGAVAVPLHAQLGAGEIRTALEGIDSTVVFAAGAAPLSEIVPSALVVDTAVGFTDALRGREWSRTLARPADPAVVLFTSGSSGKPKAVVHTHRGLAYKTIAMARTHGLDGNDVALMPAPLAHISGLLNAVLVPGSARMGCVLMAKWDAERALSLIDAERVSFMVGPPAMFTGLAGVRGFSRERVRSLRVVSSGTMGVSPDFVVDASERLGAFVKRSYGCTEAPTVTTTHAGDPVVKGAETDGRPVGCARVAIVDAQTNAMLGAGCEGEIWVRGPELFAGYLDPSETRAAVARGWFRTGDLGTFDGDGFLRVVGRLKDVIIRQGENIAPAEVEQALERHPSVRQAVVVGIPDRLVGERVAAFVVADPVFDLAGCSRWFAEQGIAQFKTPEIVRIVESIPLLPAGKPDRAALARLLGESG
jgi:cyclohexanecarboxylate-CoA ligase